LPPTGDQDLHKPKKTGLKARIRVKQNARNAGLLNGLPA
jgi:hypothetical protein